MIFVAGKAAEIAGDYIYLIGSGAIWAPVLQRVSGKACT